MYKTSISICQGALPSPCVGCSTMYAQCRTTCFEWLLHKFLFGCGYQAGKNNPEGIGRTMDDLDGSTQKV